MGDLKLTARIIPLIGGLASIRVCRDSDHIGNLIVQDKRADRICALLNHGLGLIEACEALLKSEAEEENILITDEKAMILLENLEAELARAKGDA